MRRALRGFFLLWSCCTLLACAGDLDHPENFAFLLPDAAADASGGGGGNVAPPPSCVTDLFENSCGSAACHGKGTMTIDLTSPGVEKRIVNGISTPTSVCSGRTLVATDGSQSLLLQKLTTPPCGEKMPFGGMASDADVACVRDWVASLNGAGSDDDAGGTGPTDAGAMPLDGGGQ